MSVLSETDASEVEGALKKKEKIVQKKAAVSEETNEKQPAPGKKAGWGAENSTGPSSDVTQSQIEYKFDEPEDDGATTSFPEDESISTVVSAPPKSQGNKVQTIKELDNAAQFDLPTTKDSGIDLSLLTNCLVPQDQVTEPDELWEFDKLFVKVTSELQLELEAEEEKKKQNEEREGDEDKK